MKKNLFAFAAACLIAAFGAGSAQAQDLKANATQAEIAAFEAENLIDFDKLNADGDAKFAANIVAASGEGAEGDDAKCWFWGWRCYAYTYPSYYYYTWYCPCYYVNFRLVTYTVPVVTTPVVTTTATTTTATTTTSMTAIAKSSGSTACGAVIDQTIPANSPLAEHGLQVGDVVTSVDGKPVTSLVDLRRIKADSKLTFIPGSQISVSKKALNHSVNADTAKSLQNGVKKLDSLNNISAHKKALGDKETVSLYEYYQAREKNAR